MPNLQNLLTRSMTRKEFLVFLGLAVLTISGIDKFLKPLSSSAKSGFGGGSYGG